MMTQSRFCRPVVAVSAGAVLLLVAILYIATRGNSHSHLNSVRFVKPLLVSVSDTAKLTVLPKLGPSSPARNSDEAYVALLYGEFLLTLRVLGQSLRESGTTKDMVALCMSDIPPYQKDILKKEGWIVKSVDPLPKECVGNHVYSRHFVKVQTWLLTEYRRIVLIDTDAIVLRNIDALFSCGEFCAAYRHSDLFNTGVVVLTPSEDTFRNICANIQVFGSFTNGDQGFLNYFYEDLKKATLFSKDDTADNTHSNGGGPRLQRLPAEYNGDVSIFYLVNKWMYLDTDEPYVLHYTLGPVKPWKWWTYPLFSLNWIWHTLRERLPPTSLTEPSLLSWETWIPVPLLLVLVLTLRLWHKRYTRSVSNNSAVRWAATTLVNRPSPVGRCCAMVFPIVVLYFAGYQAFYSVPLTMTPTAAWTRFGLWTLFFFSLPFTLFCQCAYILGMNAPVHSENGNGSTIHKQSSVITCRIVGELLLWLVLSISLFYFQFSITVLQPTMKKRVFSFFGFGISNIGLCAWFGYHLPLLCYRLGSYQMHSLHNSNKIPSPLHHVSHNNII